METNQLKARECGVALRPPDKNICGDMANVPRRTPFRPLPPAYALDNLRKFPSLPPPTGAPVSPSGARIVSACSWRPDLRLKMKDWVADFALAGQAALEGPACASRMVMFRLYYLGLSERGWVNWSEEIRRECGLEILRRGMFPRTSILEM